MRHLALSLSLFACTPEASDDGVEAMFVSDVEQSARVLEEVAVQPTTIAACYDGPGDCQACYEAVGTPLTGTFELGMDTTPCGGAFGSATYTVQDSAFEGGWSSSLAGVEATLTGERSATLVTSRGRTDDGIAVFTVADASLTVDAQGAVSAFALEGTYTGLGGRAYDLQLTGDGGSIEGEASSPSVTCVFSGSLQGPEVTCER